MTIRRLVTVGLAALSLAPAGPAGAQTTPLMPGVTYESGVQFTPHGPVALHIVTGPRPGGLYQLRPVLSNDTISGLETLSAMQRRLSASATTVGVNGDFFSFASGRPSGVFMHDGQVVSPPYGDRSSIGVGADGTLDVRRIEFFGTWQGLGQKRVLNDLNEVPVPNGISLFTSAWGPATPSLPGATEAVLYPFPVPLPNTDLAAPAIQLTGGGSTPIPLGGAVLVARGTAAASLAAEAPVGTTLTTRLIFRPDWAGIVNAIGGGPVLVRDGGPVFKALEAFSADVLLPRAPRTAVGQLADGRVILVATDGRQPGYSVGMTNFELAQTLSRLGAVTGAALDGGGSTTLAFEGTVLNRPSDRSERPIADALLLLYTGVFAPPPTRQVVSPNGDGVADDQRLTYKVVRPSAVTVTLTAPDGAAAFTETAQREPGLYEVAFPPLPPPPPPPEEPAPPQPPQPLQVPEPVPAPPAEGRWRLDVAAADDQGQASTMSRSFIVDATLGFLETPKALFLPPAGREFPILFTLSREARLVVTVETKAGDIVRTLATRRYPVGQVRLVWDGRTRGGKQLARGGRYVVRLVARTPYARLELVRGFRVQRIAGPKRPSQAQG
ncbi:MAG: phosphodiester glycosidase family protein [Actinobacteria bacterium]|nr:phosphodiester glycosidase family protein [Actinomycetota bacterium]